MKAITILLFFQVCCNAQIKHSNSDFFLQDKKVYWQHIYEATGNSKEDLKIFANKIFSESRLHSALSTEENTISFTTEAEIVNYKKYGGREMTTPMILRGEMTYRVAIEVQDDRYRVTIKEIYFRNPLQQFLNTSLDECISKKGEFRTSNGVSETLKYCQFHFLEKFQFKSKEESKW